MLSSPARRGTILIIVAGVSALLASLALAFLARMRSDTEESQHLLQYAQAKIMLAAACNYVQESSRLGWDRYPATPTVDGLQIHDEAYGWVDVRDGTTGPKGKRVSGTPGFSGPELADLSANKWPSVGTHVRCPMYRMKRPPYAIKLNAGHNYMVTDNPASPDYCWPLLKNRDPRPAQDVDNYPDFAAGDKTPVVDTTGKAWFRVYRDGPGTFIVTCGSGGSDGFKNWDELSATEQLQFNSDRPFFENLRNAEVRLHYRIEWSAAVTEVTYHNLQHEIARATEHYETWPPNASHTWSSSRRTQTWMKNPVGTIRTIQRLIIEPSFW
ncbi:MAG: hypothetical protein H0W78_14605 [Planctomycetes bacterium]|nr:hypothetical protein [Planctomycetota bacterium]